MLHFLPKIRLGFLNWKGKIHSINFKLKALYIPALANWSRICLKLSKLKRLENIPWFPKLQDCCLVEVVLLFLWVELPWVPPFLGDPGSIPHLRIKAISVVPLSFLSRKRRGKNLDNFAKKMFFDLQSWSLFLEGLINIKNRAH